VILLTPYLASAGLIAEVCRAGGLRPWSGSNTETQLPERALLGWLATTPLGKLPRIVVGYARDDRFAAVATLLAELLPAEQVSSTPGGHDWASLRVLWRMILDQNPFKPPPRAVPV